MESPYPSEGARDESWAVTARGAVLIEAHIPERWWGILLSWIRIHPSVTFSTLRNVWRDARKKKNIHLTFYVIQFRFCLRAIPYISSGAETNLSRKKKKSVLSNGMFSRNQVDHDNRKFSTNAPLAQVNYAEVVGEQT